MYLNIKGYNKNIIVKSLSILIITLIVYYRELYLVANEAIQNEALSHILAVPFFIGYIIYTKKNVIIASQSLSPIHKNKNLISDNEIIGIILCISSILLNWYSSLTLNIIEIKMLSLPIFIAGITLILLNYQTLKIILTPLTFLAFLIPIPNTLIQSVGSKLSIFSSEMAYELLKILQIPVNLSYDWGNPVIILTMTSGQEFMFAIDVGCSGLYSFIGFTIFTVFISYILKGNIYKKILRILMGYPIIYSLNVIRIALIIIIGYLYGTNLALDIFHLLGGWILIFIGTIILFYVSDKLFKNKNETILHNNCTHTNIDKNSELCVDCGKILEINKQKPFTSRETLKIILLILFSIILMYAQIPVFTLLGGGSNISLKTTSDNRGSLEILPEISGFTLSFDRRDIAFEKLSGQDASLWYRYDPENVTENEVIWVGIEIGQTKNCLHPWEVCLITMPLTKGWEAKATKIELNNVQLMEDPPISGKYFSYLDNEYDSISSIIYWYSRSTFQTTSGYEEKWVKISVLKMSWDPEDHKEYESDLLPIFYYL